MSNLKTAFPDLPERVREKYRSIQRVVTMSSVLEYIIMEDLPKSNLLIGQTKQRINRIHSDIEAVTRDLHSKFMMPEATAASQDFTFGLYTIMALLVDLDESELYTLGNELKERYKR